MNSQILQQGTNHKHLGLFFSNKRLWHDHIDYIVKKGGLWFFFLKKYSDSQCCWKKYSDFDGGKKKKSDSEFLSYNLMLNSGEKKNILTLVLSEKKFSERNKKP